tara:strand:- start:889 stop:1425 length:537 start_codon:yes stop_codon:yes gene_type:complete
MKGKVIWITGLSGAGKTTVANELCQRFQKHGLMPILLDGDILREIFSTNYKSNEYYNRGARIILSYQYGMLCKSLSAQGFTVIISTISMYKEVYEWNRANLPNYFEVFLKVPLKELYRRDPKGIYNKFSSGKINNVVGLDVKVDEPIGANVVVDFKPGQSTKQIVDHIVNKLDMKVLN